MIHACRCPPRLAGRQRTTGGLRESDEGPGAEGAGAAARSYAAVKVPCVRRELQRNRFYTHTLRLSPSLSESLSLSLPLPFSLSPSFSLSESLSLSLSLAFADSITLSLALWLSQALALRLAVSEFLTDWLSLIGSVSQATVTS